VGVLDVKCRKRSRQTSRSGALHAADPERARGFAGLEHLSRFVGERKHAARVAEKAFPFGAQRQAVAIAPKQRHPQFFLELLDSRGHVRLHAAKPLRGPRHAQLRGHDTKNVERRMIHDNLLSRTLYAFYSQIEILCKSSIA